MKKIIFTLTLVSSLFVSINMFGQACPGGSGTGVCAPSGGPSSGGFEDPSTTPCVVQGVVYSHGIQFSMFSVFEFLGTQSVDSIQFTSIDNLPCGLCWAVDQADKTYTAGEDGCISITGTTNDAAGQYKFALALKAWINNQANGQNIPSTLVDQTGIKILLRVKTPAGVCVNADTSASANNLTANPANCSVGVNDLAVDLSSITILPNPMNGVGMTLTFVAQKNSLYTLSISDVTGKVISTKTIETKHGYNSFLVERDNLQAGTYFVSLTDGKNVVTNRFSVID